MKVRWITDDLAVRVHRCYWRSWHSGRDVEHPRCGSWLGDQHLRGGIELRYGSSRSLSLAEKRAYFDALDPSGNITQGVTG